MANFNRIVLVGNLTEDPEVRITNGGVSMSRFTLAVERPTRMSSEAAATDFIQVTAWRELAEEIQQTAKKGQLAYLEGAIRTDSYETPQGEKRYATKVEANRFKVLTGGASASERGHEGVSPLESTGAPLSASDFDFNSGVSSGSELTPLSLDDSEEVPF